MKKLFGLVVLVLVMALALCCTGALAWDIYTYEGEYFCPECNATVTGEFTYARFENYHNLEFFGICHTVAITSREPHSFDSDADATCNACGYTREVAEHVHVWSSEWSGNVWFHWYECTADGCDIGNSHTKKDGYGRHTLTNHTHVLGGEGAHRGTCSECGRTDAMDYLYQYNRGAYNDTHHWQECGCGVKEREGAHWFDNDADLTCNGSLCGYTREGAHEHSGGTATCTEQAVCTGCGQPYGEVDSDNHDWGEWESLGPHKEVGHGRECKWNPAHYEDEEHTGGNATCTDATTCTTCHEPYYDLFNHGNNETTDWMPMSNGTHHYKMCKGCGTNQLDAPHDFDSDADATCDTCGYTRTVQTPTPTPRPTPRPTPKPVTPPPHVHEYSAATCVKPATCECGATTGEPDPNGHGWQEWVSNGDGTHMRRCWRNYNHKEIRDCTDGSNQDGVCNLCGDEMLHTLHTLIWACEQRTTERMTLDGQIKAVEGHYQQCTGCDYRTEYEFHQGTCTMLEKDEEGYEAYHRIDCDICNVTTYEDHYYVTLYDDTHHWRTCPCGYANEQETNLVPHEFAYRQIDDTGSEKYCTDCDWVDAVQTP